MKVRHKKGKLKKGAWEDTFWGGGEPNNLGKEDCLEVRSGTI